MSGMVTNFNEIDSVPIDCSLVLAGSRTTVRTVPTQLGIGDLLTVATSYPRLLDEFARQNSLNLGVTYTPAGGCEAYAATGRVDLIFDIKQSGSTLKANDLLVYRETDKLSLKVLDQIEFAAEQEERLELELEQIALTYFKRIRSGRTAKDPTFTEVLLTDQNALVKKFGEEWAELFQALLRRRKSKKEIVNESADLLFVLGLFLAKNGLRLTDVLEEDIARNADS